MKSWYICDGRVLSISEYPDLFAIIGNSFGGDGTTTFQLPNCTGKVPAQVSTSYSLGQQVGEETHTLTTNEIPSHNHNGITSDVPLNTSGTSVPNAAEGKDLSVPTTQNTTHSHQFSTSTVGGNAAHNNMQPTIFIGNVFILVE